MGNGYLDIVACIERTMATDSTSVEGVGLNMEVETRAASDCAGANTPVVQSVGEPAKYFAQWAVLDESMQMPCGAGCRRPSGGGAERFAELPMRLAPSSSVEVILFAQIYYLTIP